MSEKIVFVDCFNTVLLRKKADRDIIYDWCVKCDKEFSFEPSFFYKCFVREKRRLAILNKLRYGESEMRLEDIIRAVQTGYMGEIPVLSDEAFVARVSELYFQTEAENHLPNTEFTERLKKMKAEGDKLYVVSDFYCGSEYVKGWLEALGLVNLFDDVFVSCDLGVSKRTGKLYGFIIDKFGFDRKDVIMFGDNFRSDYLKAKSNGIESVRVRSVSPKKDKTYDKLIKNGYNYPEIRKIFDRFGKKYNYSNIAFVYYLFIRRLYDELTRMSAKDVFFLAREGFFLKKLFEIYRSTCGGSDNLRIHYLEVSRNSLLAASLKPQGEEDFDLLIREKPFLTVGQFLLTLGFSDEVIASIQRETGLNIRTYRYNFSKSRAFAKILLSPTFKSAVESRRSEQREAFGAYLNSFGCDYERDGMILVDIGWKGSMQDMLDKYFDGKVRLSGYYLGMKKPSDGTKRGLIFEKGNGKQFGNGLFRFQMYNSEQYCRCGKNRVDGYGIRDGKPYVVYDTLIDEQKPYDELIAPMQEQITEKFSALCMANRGTEYFSYADAECVQSFAKMVRKTSGADLGWLIAAEDTHYDGYARIGYTFRLLAKQFRVVMYRFLNIYFGIRFPRLLIWVKCRLFKRVKYKRLSRTERIIPTDTATEGQNYPDAAVCKHEKV